MTTNFDMSTDLLREMVGSGANGDIALSNRRRGRELMYWHGCQREDCNRHIEQRGWILLGPAFNPFTSVEYVEFMQSKHATPIEGYGNVSMDLATGPTRFKVLLEKNGLKEFPLDQLVAYGWHRSATLLQARPDLAEAIGKVQEYACEHGCPTVGPRARVFSSLEAYKQHTKVNHQETAAPEAVGRAIATTLGRNPGAGNGAEIAEIVASVIAGLQQSGWTPPASKLEGD